MPTTYTYSNLYGVDNPGGNINTENSIAGVTTQGPYSFTIEDGDSLNPGESVTFSYVDAGGNPQTATAVYQGMSTSTDPNTPYFTVNGQYGFVSNQDYDLGPGAAPFEDNTTDAFDPLLCFLAGTLIATPSGPVAIEALAIGDNVLAADGRAVPVKWIARQTVVTGFGMPFARTPVSIAPGALGPNLPMRELRITSDHALVLDGLLIQAGALVNGTTIRRIPLGELGSRFTVYHIELAAHEVILAEGVPSETFVDNVARTRFDNYPEFLELYGEPETALAELPQPRVKSARQIPTALRGRIAARAALLTAPESAAA